jgi:molecular chaperone GrpE (heat shock protein)
MAKGTLTFDLPEEQTEFDMVNRAADMWAVLDNLDQELRSHLKYASHPEWHGETVEEIRKILLDAMAKRGINFN